MVRFRKTGRMSTNIEDRRGMGGGRTAAIGGGGLGIGGLVLFLLFQFLGGGGGDLGSVVGELGAPAAPPAQQGQRYETGGAATTDQEQLISQALDDMQFFWAEQFQSADRTYEAATLVLYEQGTNTAGCGYGQAAAGPFYCPADEKVYIDLSFFDQLASQFGAPGDFAQIYVLAHEVAHHVQNELGISSQVRSEQQANPGAANDFSVRLELQADCLAGVWAYSTYDNNLDGQASDGDLVGLESGDLEEGLNAAAAVGDDNIQSGSGRNVNPETWTHGSSEQRTSWFRRGFDSGDPNQCDTFSGSV